MTAIHIDNPCFYFIYDEQKNAWYRSFNNSSKIKLIEEKSVVTYNGKQYTISYRIESTITAPLIGGKHIKEGDP